VCNLPSESSTFNGTWNAAGIIVFASNGPAGRLFQVSAAGGQPTLVMPLDESIGELRQSYPTFLPDGRHFLFLSFATGRPATDRKPTTGVTTPKPPTVTVGSLDSADRHELPITNSEVRYSSTGHLLFLRDGALMAQGFEPQRLEVSGEAFRIADDVGEGPAGSFSASSTGAIAFRPTGSSGSSQLIWYDRSGTRGSPLGPVGDYRNPELSPDGKLVAFERGARATSDIWIMDVTKGRASRLTTAPGAKMFPVWSPDGNSIVFFSGRDPTAQLYRRAVGEVGRDVALTTDAHDPPSDWSRDGRYLVFGPRGDLWAYTMTEHAPPIRLTETPAIERHARVSPDGRWIAYSSNESGGRYDVYLQSFPQPGLKQIVSTAGGVYPRWSRDGKELLYVAPNTALMSASIAASATTAVVGTPVQLFLADGLPFGGDAGPTGFRANYDVAADGRLLINDAGGSYQRPITVILNWGH
jgi:dipeptidyl aminopeptidase/acylaminoacyl peptidase